MATHTDTQQGIRRLTAIFLAGLILLAACGGGVLPEDGEDLKSETKRTAPARVTTTTQVRAANDGVDLDQLWNSCADGDFQACDDLYFASPAGSEYEAFGASCGGRIQTELLCVEAFAHDSQPPVTPTPPAEVDMEGAIRLRQVSVFDPQINNIEAFSMLVPETWSFNGYIEWRHDISTLASGIAQIFDETGSLGLETYFLEPNAWTSPSLIGPGENWGGAIFRSQMSAADYLAQVVVPLYRSGAVVVDSQSLPEVASVVAGSMEAPFGSRAYADAARVRIQYDAGGKRFEEDFYTAIGYLEGGGIVQWTPVHLYSLWAPVGELDDATPLLQTIIASTDVSLLWGANYQIVFNLFLNRQYQAIRDAGRLSEYIARTAEEIAQIHREAWQNQQATYDRVFDSYSRYTRGVDRYPLGDGGPPVLLPRAATPCLERATNVPTVLLLPLTTPCPQGTDLLTPLSP